ncbi:vinculin isoform X2 [Brachionus plicatilis]|uniref:Vinculin n=1 Tax=Brachionus plicatilis TaxID=10195 RepID=A0A3M7P6U8_BRAPC|nr:vinculin isoform X2 [Brachionus plicatilis]
MIDEFKQFSKDIKLDRITIKNAAKQLQNSLSFIVKRIFRLLIQKIADQYSDLNAPLNKLVETVHKSNGDQITDDKFKEFSIEFLESSQKLCDIATGLALSTNQIQSRNSIDLINRLTLRIKEISPHIVNAGYITITFPGDKNFLENFELLQRQWQTNIFYLQQLVDEIIDCESFIIACEKSIIRETYETQDAVLEKNTSVIVNNALSIAQKTNRIVKVTAQEAENSEDKLFVDKILQSNDKLKQSLPYFIHSAKSLALDPSDKENYLIWASSNEQLIDAIASVRECVSSNDLESNRYSIPNDQDLNNQLSQLNYLKINEDFNNNSYVPKYKPLPVSRPTPLPDLIEENENEFPEPQNNQPILMAAHDLHYSINQWYTTDNDMVAVAKRITFLMAKLSELVRGQNRSNKQLISTAKQLFDESLEICRLARLMANDCTDKRMKINLLQVCERIPTIGTQLKILSTVKATMLGHQGSREDEEATEMLICNAQNLNASVKETIRAAKSASIKLKSGSALKFKWIRKKSVESNILSVT